MMKQIPVPGTDSLKLGTATSLPETTSSSSLEFCLDNILERGAGALPTEIFRCPNVKSLSLKNNFLEWLNPEVGRMGRLERLVLTHNLLKNQSIPLTLCFCRYPNTPSLTRYR